MPGQTSDGNYTGDSNEKIKRVATDAIRRLADLAKPVASLSMPYEVFLDVAKVTATIACTQADVNKGIHICDLLTYLVQTVYQLGYQQGRKEVETLIGRG